MAFNYKGGSSLYGGPWGHTGGPLPRTTCSSEQRRMIRQWLLSSETANRIISGGQSVCVCWRLGIYTSLLLGYTWENVVTRSVKIRSLTHYDEVITDRASNMSYFIIHAPYMALFSTLKAQKTQSMHVMKVHVPKRRPNASVTVPWPPYHPWSETWLSINCMTKVSNYDIHQTHQLQAFFWTMQSGTWQERSNRSRLQNQSLFYK